MVGASFDVVMPDRLYRAAVALTCSWGVLSDFDFVVVVIFPTNSENTLA